LLYKHKEKGIINYMGTNENLVNLFTKRMKQLRLEKGAKENKELTQVAVSEALGIHVNTIRSYESSTLNQIPKIEQLMKIKNYYNVSYEYLLGETDIKSSNSSMQFICDETNLDEDSIQYLKTLDKDDELIFNIQTLIKSTKEYRNKK